MSTVIDFSSGFPSAQAIKNAGHRGAVMYISPPRENWMGAKPANRNIVKQYHDAGLETAFVWQFAAGTPQTSDVMRGARGGELDARSADEQLKAIGCEGWPVYFAADFDISLPQWNNTARAYFEAAGRVLGKDRVGIYGHSRVVHWAGPENKVVAEVAPGRFLGWITRSWKSTNPDGSGKGANYSTLYQRVHNVPGPDGIQIDINDIRHEYWGQRPPGKQPGAKPPVSAPAPERKPMAPPIQKRPGWTGDPTWLPAALRAFGVDVVEDPGWDKWGNGDFKSIWGVMAHHTGHNQTSTNTIRYGHSALRGLLSQIHLSRSGKATLVGVGVAWHAGVGSWPGLPTNNANWHTVGIEPQSDGTSPWPKEQMDAYYRICAAICWVLDKPASFVISHHEWGGQAQGKWDPGAGNGRSGAKMDMNPFRKNVQRLIDNPPFAKELEEIMADFDQINRNYPSRVEGSTWEGRPIDALYNADAHAFTARVNTVQILDEMRAIRIQNEYIKNKMDVLLDRFPEGS